jgi:hypothetical protein
MREKRFMRVIGYQLLVIKGSKEGYRVMGKKKMPPYPLTPSLSRKGRGCRVRPSPQPSPARGEGAEFAPHPSPLPQGERVQITKSILELFPLPLRERARVRGSRPSITKTDIPF